MNSRLGDPPFELPFDRYQRYAFAARLLDVLHSHERPLRVLEVGANMHYDLGRLLPGERIVYLDLERVDGAGVNGCFVQGDASTSPFADGAFDVVVALDVLEHVAPEGRPRFLAETLRVCAGSCIVGAPFHAPALVAEERRLAGYFRDLHGVDYRWLEEHASLGLPDLDETCRTVRAAGWDCAVWGHGNLQLWASLIRAHLYVNSESELVPARADIDRFYARELFGEDRVPPFYRHFIVATRSRADLDRLRDRMSADGIPPAGDPARMQERIAPLLSRLYELGDRYRHRRFRLDLTRAQQAREAQAMVVARESAARDETIHTLQEELAARDASLAQLQQTVDGLRAAAAREARRIAALETKVAGEQRRRATMEATLSWRLRGMLREVPARLRALGRLLRWRRHRMELVPSYQLVPEGDGFRSTGNDPQLLLQSSRGALPSAWVLISYQVASQEPWLNPKLYVDSGKGFSENETFMLPCGERATITRLLRLPEQVRVLRLDPMTVPGRFAIRAFSILEIGSLQAVVILVARNFRSAIVRPRDTLRFARSAAGMLRRAGIRGLRQELIARERELSDYEQWVLSYDTLGDSDRVLIRRHVEQLSYRPLISFVMPTFNTPEVWLRRGDRLRPQPALPALGALHRRRRLDRAARSPRHRGVPRA